MGKENGCDPHMPQPSCIVMLGKENQGLPGTRPQTLKVETGLGQVSEAASNVAWG